MKQGSEIASWQAAGAVATGAAASEELLQDLERSESTIDQFLSLSALSQPAVNAAGTVAMLLTSRAPLDHTQRDFSLWVRTRGSELAEVPLDVSPNGGAVAWCPQSDALAYTASGTSGGEALRVWRGGDSSHQVFEYPGEIVEYKWAPSGDAVLVLVQDGGGDTFGLPWGVQVNSSEESAPVVRTPGAGRRHLCRVELDGRTDYLSHSANIWEFDWDGADTVLAVCSSETSENSWYHSTLDVLDIASGTHTTLLEAQGRQLTSPAISPDQKRGGVVVGRASDRGLTAGTVHVVDFSTPESASVLGPDDVTWMQWDTPDAFLAAGWDDCGTHLVRVSSDGREAALWSPDGAIGSSYRPGLSVAGRWATAIYEDDLHPPELVLLDLHENPVGATTVSAFNAGNRAAAGLSTTSESWTAPDGTEIHGLLITCIRDERPRGVVAVAHGGPTIANTRTWAPHLGEISTLAAAGFAVLLPNYRGSAGRGSAFLNANSDDLGGADLEDVLAGAKHVRSQLGDETLPIGVVGTSYGGFLASAAAARGRAQAVVAISPFTDFTSFASCSITGEFVRLFEPSQPADDLAALWSKSPVNEVHSASSPTLILHGDLDLCTPASQGFELYNSLRRHKVPTELVIYRNEGHTPVGRASQADLLRRTRDWLLRHMVPPRKGSAIAESPSELRG